MNNFSELEENSGNLQLKYGNKALRSNSAKLEFRLFFFSRPGIVGHFPMLMAVQMVNLKRKNPQNQPNLKFYVFEGNFCPGRFFRLNP